ncbi:hypothetical protein BSM4216_3116 [Bacillus smithii]|jgi:hypothetical protein|nr:hypothetical protein BSM4216_3116 [Bacillus smithii]
MVPIHTKQFALRDERKDEEYVTFLLIGGKVFFISKKKAGE